MDFISLNELNAITEAFTIKVRNRLKVKIIPLDIFYDYKAFVTDLGLIN